MISILQRFLISKTHPEISVDELIQLSNFRKSWMRASFTATWDHSPQHGTKMTLEPRCDVQMVASSRCVFSRDICDPELVEMMSQKTIGRTLLGTNWRR